MFVISPRTNTVFSRVLGSWVLMFWVMLGSRSTFGCLKGSRCPRYANYTCFLVYFWHGYAKMPCFLVFQGPKPPSYINWGDPVLEPFGDPFRLQNAYKNKSRFRCDFRPVFKWLLVDFEVRFGGFVVQERLQLHIPKPSKTMQQSSKSRVWGYIVIPKNMKHMSGIQITCWFYFFTISGSFLGSVLDSQTSKTCS